MPDWKYRGGGGGGEEGDRFIETVAHRLTIFSYKNLLYKLQLLVQKVRLFQLLAITGWQNLKKKINILYFDIMVPKKKTNSKIIVN